MEKTPNRCEVDEWKDNRMTRNLLTLFFSVVNLYILLFKDGIILDSVGILLNSSFGKVVMVSFNLQFKNTTLLS
jgi:hypothetical protein